MSMKSPVAVMQAVEITFSSRRTWPGHGCCNITVCVRRVKPAIFFPYESLYFFRKNCARSGMSSAVRPRMESESESSSTGRKDPRGTARRAPRRTNRGSSPRSAAHLPASPPAIPRSEEHTSELQSPDHIVCRLLLEKKKDNVVLRHHHT